MKNLEITIPGKVVPDKVLVLPETEEMRLSSAKSWGPANEDFKIGTIVQVGSDVKDKRAVVGRKMHYPQHGGFNIHVRKDVDQTTTNNFNSYRLLVLAPEEILFVYE